MNVYLLIAEDEALRRSLRETLPEADLLLYEERVDDALRRLISIRPDAVILDDAYTLGDQGLDAIRHALATIPIVVLSNRSDADSLAHFRASGATTCLTKPFSCDELRDNLERLVLANRAPAPAPPQAHPAAAQDNALPQHQRALRWINRMSQHMESRDRLSQGLADAMLDVFDAARCAVLLEDGGGVRIAASHGLRAHLIDSVRLEYLQGLMRWFEEHACLIDRETNPEAHEAVKEMHVLGARLGAPLFAGGRVIGALLIGENAAGRAYSHPERELLTVIARAASTNLENAQLYRDVSRQQTRMDALLANVSSGVALITPDRMIAMLNETGARILQVRSNDVLGRSVQKLGSGFTDVALRALNSGQPLLRQEVTDRAINATLGLSATPLGPDGVVVMFSRLPQETTDSEDIAYSPFWEYLAERVGQEIKNPMVAINTFAQLLPRKYDSEDFRTAFTDVVQKEIGRVNNVAETLFEFARHPRLVMQACDLNATVEQVLRTFQHELSAHSIDLQTELDPEQPFASLDPIYFAQALHNIVQNSIEAMDAGGTLSVRTRKENGRCEIEVSDSGPGVSEQDAENIFMPFFSTKEQGMGLGLTVATRIIQQHNGDLQLLSRPTGGGAFAMRLPENDPQSPESPDGSP
jgi:signal transduction histidine kinase/DNA-binding NarL/FixJ family response regulator